MESISDGSFEKRAETLSFVSHSKDSIVSFIAYYFILIKTDLLHSHCIQLTTAGGLG